uniref:Uncharacterized protein n=1 Tax=Oryza rufipogon TaxID=4529 RepID=A0A0E0P8A5_ORYRU
MAMPRDSRKSKDFQVLKETIDKGPINDDMRPIDEKDISTLNMDQISQIEILLEDELRWTRARKVQKKPATAETESNSTEMPSDHEKKQVAGGSQQSAEEKEEMEVVLRHRLSLGTGDRDDGGGGAAEQRHRTTPPPAVDLNVPCRDAGQLQ